MASVVDIALGVATAGLGYVKAKATFSALTALAGAKLAKGGVTTLGSHSVEASNLAALEMKSIEGRLNENYTLEQTHHRNDYDAKRNLRNMGNVQQAASVTYRDIINKSNQELGASDIHLRI